MLCQLHFAMHLIHAPDSDRTKHMTFRKPALTLFASIGITVVGTGFVLAAVLPKPSKGTLGAAVLFSSFVYVIWLVGWHSAVRLNGQGVIVDNLLARHVIPWSQLTEIGVGNGLLFKLRDGASVGSVTYGGSVLGALFGYRYTAGVAARMTAAREQILSGTAHRSDGGAYRRVIGFSPWPPLVILAVMEAIAALSLLRG
jgi:hypothetical protein